MHRRLFFGHLMTGLGVCSVNHTLVADTLVTASTGTLSPSLVTRTINWAQAGLLGNLQHISLSHVYNPETTSLSTLAGLAQRDFAQLDPLFSQPLVLDSATLLADTRTAAFGSYSVRLEHAGVSIVWQGLADIRGETNAPVASLLLHGSEAVAQLINNGQRHEVRQLNGRLLLAASLI